MNANMPWYLWERASPAAQAPQCQAAAESLLNLLEHAVAASQDAVIDDSQPWGLRVQIGGAEVDVVVRPTGVLEKTCASVTCENRFWRGESGSTTARFCSSRCRNQQKMRDYRARKAEGPVQPIPRVISRILAGAGLARGERAESEGFWVHQDGASVVVCAPPDMQARCVKILEAAGYADQMRAGALLVTGSQGRQHGYVGYTHGCRCKICRKAKADYMTSRRNAAYLNDHEVPENIRHGTAFAYQEHGCRCEPCVTAERNSSRHPRAARPFTTETAP